MDLNKHWADDILNRRASADFLSNYLTGRYQRFLSTDRPDSFVIAINADWGFGKTFLVKKWSEQLRNQDYPVVYFDAWANDFTSNALLGFISELDAGLSPYLKRTPKGSRIFHNAMSLVPKLTKRTVPLVAEILSRRLTQLSTEDLAQVLNEKEEEIDNGAIDQTQAGATDDVAKDVSTIVAASAKALLKDHENTKRAIRSFRENMIRLVTHLKKLKSIQLPIFIFIDELDRCRPTYAIELLECIKHLFGTPGVYFVVSVNTPQLARSVAALYGAQFDGESYLRRFFDQEYLLPDPDNGAFAEHLFQLNRLSSETRFYAPLDRNDMQVANVHQRLFSLYATMFRIGLRDQIQMAAMVSAVLESLRESQSIHTGYLFFLAALRQKSREKFQALRDGYDRYKSADSFKSLLDGTADLSVSVMVSNHEQQRIVKHPLYSLALAYYRASQENLVNNDNAWLNKRGFPARRQLS